MPNFSLPYGTGYRKLSIPDHISVELILPAHHPPSADPVGLVLHALNHPVEFSWDIFSSARSVAIAINDKTRPVPHNFILPALVNHLLSMGISPAKIQFLIATGTHLPIPADEFSKIMPISLVNEFVVRSHNINNHNELVQIGQTSYGTKVSVNRHFYEADLKIVVGNIEPHHFAGYSGGMKTAAIGLGGRETINHNHSMLGHPNAWIGQFANNPLRQDIEEIGKLIDVHLALNVILNQELQIVDALAGEPLAVIKAGIPHVNQICGVRAKTDFDLVIASAGGKPKDINFYQAQKALTHASMFTRPGAPILLVAACPDGSGSAAYEELMQGIQSVDDVFSYFDSHPFNVGPHKALQVARILQRNPVILLSDLPDNLVRKILLQPAHSLQSAVDDTLKNLSPEANIAVLPHATSTITL